MINVKDYGAVGDGVTDDKAAINSALSQGEGVYFPAGEYLITGRISVNTPNITLKGDGGATIDDKYPQTTIKGDVGVMLDIKKSGVSVDDIHFIDTGNTARAIQLSHKATIGEVRRCSFEGFDYPIQSYPSDARVYLNKIKNSQFWGWRKIAVDLGKANGGIVEKSTFWHAADSALACLRLGGGCTQFTVVSNNFECKQSNQQIMLEDCFMVSFLSNRFESAAGVSDYLILANDVNGIYLTGNYLQNGNHVIRMEGSTAGVLIDGNLINLSGVNTSIVDNRSTGNNYQIGFNTYGENGPAAQN